MNMWGGAFSPTMRKSIGTVRFIPLVDMTARDWDWLDYDNIRPVAQNRIANVAVKGKLLGFFQVMITEKAAKKEYLWPATAGEVADFEQDGNHDFFGHEPETLTETDAVAVLERMRLSASLVPTWALLAIARAIAVHLINEEAKQRQAEKVNEAWAAELDNDDIAFVLSIIMLWEMALEEAETLLDDFPDSDDTDEVRSWIEDRVREVAQARQQIAAGRGLTPPGTSGRF